MQHLEGRVAAITGAGSGIGAALAEELARRGCDLALSDVDGTGLEVSAASARAHGAEVTTAVVDVADAEAVQRWADETAAEHGQVNLVVNNAGVALSGTVESLSLEDYRWIVDINFWGVVHGTKAFLPHLVASGSGHVVNISSVFGLTAQPLMSGYNATKYAVRGFTESLRQDLELAGLPVSATCVHPGGIATNVAKAARVDASVARLTGRTAAEATKEFERTLLTRPEVAARRIVEGVVTDRRRVLVGADARGYDLLARVLPTGYQRLTTGVVRWRSRG